MKHAFFVMAAIALITPTGSLARLDDLVCDDTIRLEDQLTSVVGAERQGYGLHDPESVLEIWIVPETGDWTVVQNYANGTSCIMAMGDHWQAQLQEPA